MNSEFGSDVGSVCKDNGLLVVGTLPSADSRMVDFFVAPEKPNFVTRELAARHFQLERTFIDRQDIYIRATRDFYGGLNDNPYFGSFEGNELQCGYVFFDRGGERGVVRIFPSYHIAAIACTFRELRDNGIIGEDTRLGSLADGKIGVNELRVFDNGGNPFRADFILSRFEVFDRLPLLWQQQGRNGSDLGLEYITGPTYTVMNGLDCIKIVPQEMCGTSGRLLLSGNGSYVTVMADSDRAFRLTETGRINAVTAIIARLISAYNLVASYSVTVEDSDVHLLNKLGVRSFGLNNTKDARTYSLSKIGSSYRLWTMGNDGDNNVKAARHSDREAF